MNALEEFSHSIIDLTDNSKKAYIMDLYTVLREKFYHFWDFPKQYQGVHSLIKDAYISLNTKSIDSKIQINQRQNNQIIPSIDSLIVPVRQSDKDIISVGLSSNKLDNTFWNYFLERRSIMQVLDHLLNVHELNSGTIRRKMSALFKFEDFLWINNIVYKKEVHGIPMPRIKKKEPNPLSQSEIRKILKLPLLKKNQYPGSLRDKALLEILYGTGLRVESVSLLKIEDINLEGKYLVAQVKRGNYKTKPLTDTVVKWLKKYMESGNLQNESKYLFPGRNGPMKTRSIYRKVREYGQQLNLHIFPHRFRTSLATHIAMNGGDTYDVQEQLDHAHPSTSESYVKVGKKLRNPMKYHPRK